MRYDVFLSGYQWCLERSGFTLISLFCWLIMQMTHNGPIDQLNVMENSLQSIGRLTQTLLPGQAVRLFIAGEEEGGGGSKNTTKLNIFHFLTWEQSFFWSGFHCKDLHSKHVHNKAVTHNRAHHVPDPQDDGSRADMATQAAAGGEPAVPRGYHLIVPF